MGHHGAGRLERLSAQIVGGAMSSHPYPCKFLLVLVLATLGGLSDWEPLLWAAPPNSKQGGKSPTGQSLGLDRKSSAVPPKASAKLPAKAEPNRALAAGPQGPPVDRAHRKTSRHRKAGKKLRSPAIVQPKSDLSYHGMFEQPQRYYPSRDRQTGRAPNPQAGELQQEHFQELDKNHDGMIDPFERAFGRLDMDRDVSNHQWE